MLKKERLNGLDLFSGIGGISEGLRQWVNTIAYCDKEPYAQAILLNRMADGYIERAPIWDDITTLKGSMLPGVEIIMGGFPCQDISIAGTGAGLEGKRSGLFFELCRLVEEIQPGFVFLENVPAIRTRGLREVVRKFTDLGYDCRWSRLSAAEVGAPHIRQRWFLLAHSKGYDDRRAIQKISKTNEGKLEPKKQLKNKTGQFSNAGADATILATGIKKNKKHGGFEFSKRWGIEPDVGRMVNGIPFRMDRIRALGNAVVPQQVEEAFKRLIGQVEAG